MDKAGLAAYAKKREAEIREQDNMRRRRSFMPLGFGWTLRWWLRRRFFRSRRKCPQCGAIGSFKAYGTLRPVKNARCRRLLCKWCGWYNGEDGLHLFAFADMDRRVWTLPTFWPRPIYERRLQYGRMFIPAERWGKRLNPWAG